MEEDFMERLYRESEEILQNILREYENNLTIISKEIALESMRVALRKLGTTYLTGIYQVAQEKEHYEVCQVIYEILPERVAPNLK